MKSLLIACGDKRDLSSVSKRQSRIEEFPIIGLQKTPARIPDAKDYGQLLYTLWVLGWLKRS